MSLAVFRWTGLLPRARVLRPRPHVSRSRRSRLCTSTLKPPSHHPATTFPRLAPRGSALVGMAATSSHLMRCLRARLRVPNLKIAPLPL